MEKSGIDDKMDAIQFIKENKIDLASNDDPRIICQTIEGYGQLGLGPFIYEERKEMLRKLFQVQKRIKEEFGIDHELIKREELLAISKLWLEQGYWNNDVSKIYKEVFKKDLEFVSDDIKLLNDSELEDLKDICISNGLDFELVKKILYLEKNSYGLTRRDSLQKELSKLLNQDYIHI